MAVYIFPVPIDHDRFEKVFEEFSNDFGLFVGLFFLFNLWEIWEAASPDCESMAEKTLQSFQSNRLTSGKYVESVAEKRGKTIFDAARATTICLRVARWNQSSPAAFFFPPHLPIKLRSIYRITVIDLEKVIIYVRLELVGSPLCIRFSDWVVAISSWKKSSNRLID